MLFGNLKFWHVCNLLSLVSLLSLSYSFSDSFWVLFFLGLISFLTFWFSRLSLSIRSEASGNVPSTPQRITLSSSPKKVLPGSTAIPSAAATKRNSAKAASAPTFNKSEVMPVIVPRNSIVQDMPAESKKEVGLVGRTMPFSLQSKATDFRRFPHVREDVDKPAVSVQTESTAPRSVEFSISERSTFPGVTSSVQGISSEKNTKDDRGIGSGRLEMSSMTEPTASCQPDSCKYLTFRRILVQSHNIFELGVF